VHATANALLAHGELPGAAIVELLERCGVESGAGCAVLATIERRAREVPALAPLTAEQRIAIRESMRPWPPQKKQAGGCGRVRRVKTGAQVFLSPAPIIFPSVYADGR
jgi:hypothetical protein